MKRVKQMTPATLEISTHNSFHRQQKYFGKNSTNTALNPVVTNTRQDTVAFYSINIPITTSSSALRDEHEKSIRFTLHHTFSSDWEFVKPIPVIVEFDTETDNFLISDEIFVEYGVGKGIEDAKKDYVDNLINYYHFMEERSIENDPETSYAFSKLQEYLMPIEN